MYTSLINYINHQYGLAEFHANTPQEVHDYMQNAFGAVGFFCSLDDSEGVDGELRNKAIRKWNDYYHEKFYALMREKA